MNGAIILINKNIASNQKRGLIHFHYSICLAAGVGFDYDIEVKSLKSYLDIHYLQL